MFRKPRLFYMYIFFVIVYLSLTILAPPNKAVLHHYHISATMARLLSTTVVIPVVGIWFAAFYGFSKLSKYARLIKKNKDGRHVSTIARGVGFIAVGMPINSTVTTAMNVWAQYHAAFTGASSIMSGYISLFIPIVGFLTIGGGSRGLIDTIRQRLPRLVLNAVALLVATLGVIYCYFVFANRHVQTIYHMSAGVLMITVVIPYLFLWFIGLLAAAEIFVYSRKVPGVIYRKSWELLSAGLGAVIITSVALQYIVSLTNRISRLKIGALLMLVYVLLLLLASGYVTIALGAKKLQKIEEV